MKKISLILISLLFLTGCTNNFHDQEFRNIDNDIIDIISTEDIHTNSVGKGFKYYRPRGFTTLEENEFNIILVHNYNKYYFNVDINAYNLKYENKFIDDGSFYYVSTFSNNDISGYVTVKEANNGYFYVKMMYNYSYVEAKVSEIELYDTIIDSAIILASIKYNDKVIASLITNSELSAVENPYELKKPKVERNERQNILDFYESVN